MKYHFIFCLWCISVTFGSCQSQSTNGSVGDTSDSLFPYVLNADTNYIMPPELEEISGISFVEGKANALYAIQDEAGLLFEYDLIKKKVSQTTSFGKKGDYEELATDGNFFYVLKSNGHIYSFPVRGITSNQEVVINKDLVPKAEYEAMAFDPVSGNLFLLCKACKIDKKGKAVSGYILRRGKDGRLSHEGEFNLQIDALSVLDQKIQKTFKPSAMARRVSSNEWYILSSIDRSLVVTDEDFNPKRVVHLARKSFEQPEGVAFDSEDNLYISSEVGQKEHGMIYRFNLSK